MIKDLSFILTSGKVFMTFCVGDYSQFIYLR